MKKVLFFMSFFLLIGMTSNAQTAKKGCCSSKAKSSCSKKAGTADANEKLDSKTLATAGEETRVMSMAMTAAEGNEDIKTRQCAESGKTSFYQKSECKETGKISWNEVKYDESTKEFTQVAAASMERPALSTADTKKGTAAKACCSKGSKSSCSKKSTTSVEEAPKKASEASQKIGS